jgi:beta-phosphoglucomutase
MNEPRGVLWDLDGVLADTGEFHFQSWMDTLSVYGIPFSPEEFQATFGMNNKGILTTLLGHPPEDALLMEISEKKEHNFRTAIQGKVQPLPGVKTWLERFRQARFCQAVASSAPPENIDTLVDELDIRAYFGALVSGFDLPGKPDPAVFLKAARMLQVPAGRCLVIEDAVAGVRAAVSAGMKCVAVTTTNPADLLSDADIVVDRLEALKPDAVERLMPPGVA